jgi:hypothetical protein
VRKAFVASDRQRNATNIRPKRMKSRIQFSVLTLAEYVQALWRYSNGFHDTCTSPYKRKRVEHRHMGNINRPRQCLSQVIKGPDVRFLHFRAISFGPNCWLKCSGNIG